MNSYADIPISIYYDFEDDGPDPKETEQNFGTVHNPYNNQSVPHIPKPAYQAAFMLQKTLGSGYKLLTRVDAADPATFVLAFSPQDQSNDMIYALWKSGGTPIGTCASVIAPVDCGFSGISQQQCLDKGCCFQIPAPSGPQCYYHAQNTTGNVEFHPTNPGCFNVLDIYGNTVTSRLCTDNNGKITVLGSDSPLYLNRIKAEDQVIL